MNGGWLSRPYTDDDDPNTKRATPCAREASNTRCVPVTLTSAKRAGSASDGRHARERRQVDDDLRMTLREHALQRVGVADVALDERELRLAAQLGEVLFLVGARVEGVEVVEPDDVVAARAQPLGQVRTDESAAPVTKMTIVAGG